jgi:hypothetical protein
MSVVARLVSVVVFSGALGLATQEAGCGAGLRSFDEINDPSDDEALRECRQQGRAALDAGRTPEEAFRVYERCTQDAGFR